MHFLTKGKLLDHFENLYRYTSALSRKITNLEGICLCHWYFITFKGLKEEYQEFIKEMEGRKDTPEDRANREKWAESMLFNKDKESLREEEK